jgi:hypothetical protein
MAGGELDLDLLRSLPAETQQVPLRSPRGVVERTFRGPTLHAYALKAGLLAAHSGDRFGACYFLATASDGFRVTVAFYEVMPSTTSKRVMLAYEQDGEPVRAGIRLVVPGDDLGGRSISGLATLETREVLNEAPRSADTLALIGLLERPGPADAALIEAGAVQADVDGRRVHGHDTSARSYAGLGVFALLESAGLKLNPEVNEDIVGKVIVARSADGSASVIAAGELEPRFMNGTALVAVRRDGAALKAAEGPYRLVIEYDANPGRWTKLLAALELREG